MAGFREPLVTGLVRPLTFDAESVKPSAFLAFDFDDDAAFLDLDQGIIEPLITGAPMLWERRSAL
jgi:hypothetical protein